MTGLQLFQNTGIFLERLVFGRHSVRLRRHAEIPTKVENFALSTEMWRCLVFALQNNTLSVTLPSCLKQATLVFPQVRDAA